MKKSNIILLSFIGFIFLLAFAVHAALNVQYKKGNFEYRNSVSLNQFDTLRLPVFSNVVYRSQNPNKGRNRANELTIRYDSAGSNQLLINKANRPGLVYKVINDTLFIDIPDPKDEVYCELNCTRLSSIATSSNTGLYTNSKLDKLDIMTGSYLYMQKLNVDEMNITLNNDAYCEIDSGANIQQLSLEMRGASTFEAGNSSVNFNKTKFSENSKLVLSGRALQSFTRP